MLIKIIKKSMAKENEVTDKRVYLNRRNFIFASLATIQSASALDFGTINKNSTFSTTDKLTPVDVATGYNNFYEFGTSKSDPAKHIMPVDNWTISVDGLVETPKVYNLEDILKLVKIEERIYRLRCVEAWSMVIPWLGFTLSDLIAIFKPLNSAKFIRFETKVDQKYMVGINSTSIIHYPYIEALTMQEAMHPLAFIALGMYGEELLTQNGAPIRLVIPWKYGFKSIKSIVKISFVDEQPLTTWEKIAPTEYGFYANVNPNVNHPRWSQAYEKRLPSGFFSQNKIATQLFNGYDEVANLYTNLDLTKHY